MGSGHQTNRHLAELRVLDQRMNWIHNAIMLSTMAILLVCLLIVALFSVELIATDLSRVVAILFIATMASLIGGLISFLIEISYARKSLRVRAELLASRAPHHCRQSVASLTRHHTEAPSFRFSSSKPGLGRWPVLQPRTVPGAMPSNWASSGVVSQARRSAASARPRETVKGSAGDGGGAMAAAN
jgi:hypothetical protein